MADLELAGYRVGELVGFGATGEVWRAIEISTGDTVAVKRLTLPAEASAQVVSTLRTETGQLAQVRTPHLLRLRHVVEGVLVYDFADGGSLEALLSQRGRLEPGEVVTLAMPLARTLSVLHAAGLVHGDIAPSSVLFTADGMPLLSDFGLARIIAAAGVEGGAEGAYVDPALRGGQPTTASDVWALASVCHHALSGSPPEPASSESDLLGQRAGVAPQALVAAVEAALEADPDLRPDAAAFARALRQSCAPTPVRLRGGAEVSTAEVDEMVDVTVAPTSGARPRISISALRKRPGDNRGERDGAASAGSVRLPPPRAGAAPSVGLEGGWSAAERLLHSRPVQLAAGGALVLVGSALIGWQLGRAPVVEAALLEAAPSASTAAQGAAPSPAAPADPSVRAGTSGPVVPLTPSRAAITPAPTRASSGGPVTTSPIATSPVPASPVPASPVPASPVTAADWHEVLDQLDAARARAFATADASVLAQVHAPGSAALSADRGAVTALARDRRFATGVRHSVASVDVLPRQGEQVRLRVVDEMVDAQIVDRDGKPLQRLPSRGAKEWVMALQPVGGGWRIASITPAA